MRKNLEDLRRELVAWKGWETNSRHNNTWACISKATVTLGVLMFQYKNVLQKI